MENTNEQVQVDAVEQEDQALAEITIDDGSSEPSEEVVTVSKSEFNKMKRQAMAYKAASKKPITNAEVKQYDILEDEVADLLMDGYKKDEIKFIRANGGRKALEDNNSYVSVAIKAKRDQRNVEESASQVSNKHYVVSGDKTYTEEQMRNMSSAELEKILPQA